MDTEGQGTIVGDYFKQTKPASDPAWSEGGPTKHEI